MYDLCIVGAGMIGSAAARHATITSGLNTCLIGPSEPKKTGPGSKCDVYGSYYDEGRIACCLETDYVWSTLIQESIKKYRDLEKQSGINFFHKVGNLVVVGETFLNQTEEQVSRNGIQAQKLDNNMLIQRFPYLRFRNDSSGIIEMNKSGYINPRRMVLAQKTIAAKQGCTIFDDVVNHVTRIVQSDGTYAMLVKTDGGRSVLSRKVLLATGAFTIFKNLLPGFKPNQRLSPLIVSLLEVEKTDLKIFSSNIHLYNLAVNRQMYNPRKGRYYIKLCLHGAVSSEITSLAEMKQWFEKGDSKIAENVGKFTASLFKGVKFGSRRSDNCVLTETPTEIPFIDMVHSQLGVAIGGNGRGAQMSEEIGRLAVNMMTDKWDSQLPRQIFKLETLPTSVKSSFTSHKAKL